MNIDDLVEFDLHQKTGQGRLLKINKNTVIIEMYSKERIYEKVITVNSPQFDRKYSKRKRILLNGMPHVYWLPYSMEVVVEPFLKTIKRNIMKHDVRTVK